MRKLVLIIVIFAAAAILVVCNSELVPYSQTQIIKKSKQMLTENGNDYNLHKWFENDKRVCIDTLIIISSPNISQYDSVRTAIFNALTEIKDTNVLKLMSVKVVSGNPIEKLTASAYIYQYYGIEIKTGKDIPLASMLVLFHTVADKLQEKNSSIYKNNEHKIEIAQTFPESETLYKEFIMNNNLDFFVRAWFVESLLEADEREIAIAFLMDLQTELNEKDPVLRVINETSFALMNDVAGGSWVTP